MKFGYDPLTNMVDGLGTTAYGYTAAGQLLTEDGPFASDTVTNTYSNRQRVALGLQQPTGSWTNAFAYDAARRMTNVVSPAGPFAYQYLAKSGLSPRLVARLSLPNTAYITNQYDGVSRLTETLLNNSANSALDSALYGYNPASQRTTFTNAAGTYVTYSYDPLGQVKVASSSSSSEDVGYAYDAAWNMSYKTNNGVANAFTVNNLNELTQYIVNFSYDANGNMITNNGYMVYAYDDENRLTMMTDEVYHSYQTEFDYDGLGRLRRRIEYTWVVNSKTGIGSWVGSSTVQYIYDGNRVIQERDGGGNPLVSYTRGPDLSGTMEGAGGIGGLLARSDGYTSGNWTNHNYYHADGLGNITYLIDSNQSMTGTYRYDPFSNTLSSSGTLSSANVYRFSSKEIHVNSGFYYFLYRFYVPGLQRWLNRDPIRQRASLNVYAMVYNNTTEYVDPFGLDIYGNPLFPGPVTLWPAPPSQPSEPIWPPPTTLWPSQPPGQPQPIGPITLPPSSITFCLISPPPPSFPLPPWLPPRLLPPWPLPWPFPPGTVLNPGFPPDFPLPSRPGKGGPIGVSIGWQF
ncbi:MAG TPA: RHS repeat-associated core domain-containing protein [Verrucomicrobiae bacterium]|nr:RHS repeat-associated core domain-containing protein [Verrucomicrobiae bacterium]